MADKIKKKLSELNFTELIASGIKELLVGTLLLLIDHLMFD